MATYAIGDLQGCYRSLCGLLDKLDFDDGDDELWFCGDLVNRGPQSAEVIRLIKSLNNTRVVLGNHDLHLLAVARGFRQSKHTDSFADVLQAADRDELLYWLRGQPLAYFDTRRAVLLVHAGLHPSWTLPAALDHAREVESLMAADDTFAVLLERMYGGKPHVWDADMDRFDRARWIINAFTRMRFCDQSGRMDFKSVGPPGTQPADLSPWYLQRSFDGFRVIFGHWSALGARDFGPVIALDSGCVYGNRLTAINVDEHPPRFVHVHCSEHTSGPLRAPIVRR